MFGNRLKLFRLFGFTVQVDASWIFIAVLVSWSLATGYFPGHYRELGPAAWWAMGILGALGLFASIVFHEFWHSLVARTHGIEMKGITLFLFGGVAETGNEPQSPGAEFWMAVAGPVASALLGLACYGLYLAGVAAGWSLLVRGVLGYLGLINWVLAGFNLVPAFPLDGGRILRSVLWKWRGDPQWATRIVVRMGMGFGVVLMVFGGVSLLYGSPVAGLWYFILGLFLRGAARASGRAGTPARPGDGS